MQRAPQDPALLESYLRQHFEEVEMIGNGGGFSLKEIKNLEDVPLPDTSKLASLSSLEFDTPTFALR